MKLKIDDFWDKWSKEERDAVCEYATAVANSYLNAYRIGSFQGHVIGVVAMMTCAYIGFRLSVAKEEKLAQNAKNKTEPTDSE